MAVIELPEFSKGTPNFLKMVIKITSAFTSIKQGLDEAVEYSGGRTGKVVVHDVRNSDIKKGATKRWPHQADIMKLSEGRIIKWPSKVADQ